MLCVLRTYVCVRVWAIDSASRRCQDSNAESAAALPAPADSGDAVAADGTADASNDTAAADAVADVATAAPADVP